MINTEDATCKDDSDDRCIVPGQISCFTHHPSQTKAFNPSFNCNYQKYELDLQTHSECLTEHAHTDKYWPQTHDILTSQ